MLKPHLSCSYICVNFSASPSPFSLYPEQISWPCLQSPSLCPTQPLLLGPEPWLTPISLCSTGLCALAIYVHKQSFWSRRTSWNIAFTLLGPEPSKQDKALCSDLYLVLTGPLQWGSCASPCPEVLPRSSRITPSSRSVGLGLLEVLVQLQPCV